MEDFDYWNLQAKKQNTLYQATHFWRESIPEILYDLNTKGIDNFRKWPSSLKFFVPVYLNLGGNFSDDQVSKMLELIEPYSVTFKQKKSLTNFFSGYAEAESDFRVVQTALFNTANERLLQFSESEIGNPKEQFNFDGKRYSRSSLNYLMALSCLGKFTDLSQIQSVLEIGGGFGTLGEIISKSWPARCQYINFDIPPICNISSYYLSQVSSSFSGLEEIENINDFSFSDISEVNVAANWKIENFKDTIDLFVNLISFQEMEPDVIKNYLDLVEKFKPVFILLRHIREGKQQRSDHSKIGVIKPTKPAFYQNNLNNYELLYSSELPFGYFTADEFHSDVIIYKRKTSI